MTSKTAVKLAYIEFQKDFEDGEETNQWLTNIIDGLKQAEKDLEILGILKNKIGISSVIDYGTLDYPLVFGRMSQQERDKIKEWLNNDK